MIEDRIGATTNGKKGNLKGIYCAKKAEI